MSLPTAAEQLLSSLGMGSYVASPPPPATTIVWSILNPTLPPILAPLPFLCRLLSFLVLLPIILYGMVDFAGYAVFRTLGLRRRRVRVKRELADADAPMSVTSIASLRSPSTRAPGAASPGVQPAPLLSPGAYDAQTLLRHRARSASSASAEANEEWLRTGGSFARVTAVRAEQAKGGGMSTALGSRPHLDLGVPGSLALDTDDSGPESGAASPASTFSRLPGARGPRRGIGGSSLGFTPVDPLDRTPHAVGGGASRRPSDAEGEEQPPASKPFPTIDEANAAHANALSASLSSLSTTGTGASWVGVEPLIHTAAAADLEPEASYFATNRTTKTTAS